MFEKLTVATIVWIVLGDLAPDGFGMVHMINMGEFVENDVIAEWFRDFHEADIERNCAG